MVETIRFYDHYSCDEPHDLKQIKAMKPVIVTARGEVMREDKEFVFLAETEVDYGNHKTYRSTWCIVKGAILDRKKI